ncbi:MAG: glycosyltransferase family 4 protein [Chloroflexota bacterium]
MRLFRSFIADYVIYQSRFVSDWWNKEYGVPKVASTIIYNGVDLAQFNPRGSRYQSRADVCLLSVEGMQGVDPFDIAIQLAQGLEKKGLRVELLLFGAPGKGAQSYFARHSFTSYRGPIPNSQLPHFYRGATVYVSTDILNAGCPNSVIEALACGTPVLGYNTGVLPEVLTELAGRCVECEGDPWKGEPPGNREGMVRAALELLADRDFYHRGARRLAEERYSLEKMVDDYCRVLLG